MVQTNSSHVSIYKRTLWSPDFIQGLETNFSINYKEKVKELEKQVRQMLDNINYENGGELSSTLKVLELIDNLERLGLGYRFQTSITQILNKIAQQDDEDLISWRGVEEDEENILLAVVSLKFRLLRQHGYRCSAQGFCRRFKDSRGVLAGRLQKNTKALLSIYEASYLALDGETDLNEAKLFATENLLNKLHNNSGEYEVLMNEQVKHALDIPLYRMMARLEARWYIDAYSKREDANRLLLELATLNFNMVQSVHKIDLQELSKWWKEIGLTGKLSFIRDRLVECFFASVGIVFEPQYSCCRIGLTKVCSLINSIDDIYDIYGSLDELKVFTNAVKRWEVSEMECMPEYLQIGFLALYNTVNEMGYETLITHGKNIIPILSKAWGDLADAFLVEATWTHGNVIPSFEDYLDNAWVSVSGVLILTHGYFLMNQDFKKDTIESLEKCRDLYKWSSMLLRLYNDLAISSDEIEKEGDANAILCYMHQHGVCEEVAREYIKTSLVEEIWKKMMEARIACCEQDVDAPLTDIAISLARISYCIYQYGDGVKAPDEASAKDRILSIIMEPITIQGIGK
uniref:(E)-beta-ocimene synthase, chloroplastic-like n=1 Tax=Erigeron canadensis TaxID=72917 RepID=UPI001CB92F38|nr:(E)-beta-ocimene synthase, chloroplastic-like [Erigeron canadensis]